MVDLSREITERSGDGLRGESDLPGSCPVPGERIRHGLARKKNIDEKKMFGGIVFMLNGNLLWKDSLCVRLGPDQA